MNDDYRKQLLAAVQEMEREQYRQQVRKMSNEDLENTVCDSLGVPRGTQFSIEQLEFLVESAKMRMQANQQVT